LFASGFDLPQERKPGHPYDWPKIEFLDTPQASLYFNRGMVRAFVPPMLAN
jgi:hypothetical protein